MALVCQSYLLGGYEDWRLPDYYELKTLKPFFDKADNYFNNSLFNLSGSYMWTNTELNNENLVYSFRFNNTVQRKRKNSDDARVLPVRTVDMTEIDISKYINTDMSAVDPIESKLRGLKAKHEQGLINIFEYHQSKAKRLDDL